MEGLTDGPGVDGLSPAQAEQRLVIRGSVCERGLTQILDEQCFELGAEWHETALVELRVANEEHRRSRSTSLMHNRHASPTRNPSPYRTAKSAR
jgi:hypothetical protein